MSGRAVTMVNYYPCFSPPHRGTTHLVLRAHLSAFERHAPQVTGLALADLRLKVLSPAAVAEPGSVELVGIGG